MKLFIILLLFSLNFVISKAQAVRNVSQQKMEEVYQQVKTPFKYGMVMVPADNIKKLDCPTVFRKGSKWFMTYLQFDGRGYETWLAESKDLLNWKTKGRIMSFGDTLQEPVAWDANHRAGYASPQDPIWGGTYQLKRFNGKYWMPYFGGAVSGYEAGLLSMGMAFTKRNPTKAHEWQRLPKPILTSLDADVRWWENKKLFKPTVVWDESKLTGYPFVMYYNANGDSAINNIKTRWYERIGMAVSNDMVTWIRFNKEPVVHHSMGITGDPNVQKIGDLWVMFYFGAFWEGRKDSFNRFACSYDLVNWTDWTGADLINSTEPYDERFAHKSSVIHHNGITYHFYCAVNTNDQRGIAVATSTNQGKSNVHFVAP